MHLPFEETYMGKLRARIGRDTVLVPGVRIVIENDDGRVLLVRRQDDGKWALPAGLPELNESVADVIRREVWEEASLRLGEFTAFGFSSDPKVETHTYPNGDRTQAFAILLCSREFSGTPSPNDGETTEVRFFARDEFPPRESFLANEYLTLLTYFEWKSDGRFRFV